MPTFCARPFATIAVKLPPSSPNPSWRIAASFRPCRAILQFLREITRDNDILLIFDEVITGLRASRGGAQELYGIRPDITVLAKALGAGFAVAAYGGPRAVMEPVARDEIFHAGTYNANVVAMSAAYSHAERIGQAR